MRVNVLIALLVLCAAVLVQGRNLLQKDGSACPSKTVAVIKAMSNTEAYLSGLGKNCKVGQGDKCYTKCNCYVIDSSALIVAMEKASWDDCSPVTYVHFVLNKVPEPILKAWKNCGAPKCS